MKKLTFIFFFTVLIFATFFSFNLFSQQTVQKFTRQTDYLLSLPEGYNSDTTVKWPLMIFLHGSGERGNDLEKVKMHGPPKLVAAGKKFPFILISPQAKNEENGWDPEQLYQMLIYIKEAYRVDPDRVYLTGLSMGGFGTWTLAINHPEEFAAIVPICGGGDTAKAWRLRYVPVWCFHGALDNVVPVLRSEEMVSALRAYNPSVKFTEYPDLYHNSWERTYNNDSVYIWLLAHKKFRYKETKLDPQQLKGYTGTFVGGNGDTIRMRVDSGGLHAKTKEEDYLLKTSAENTFFLFENVPVDLKFIRNSKGQYDSFIVFEENKTLYRKIK